MVTTRQAIVVRGRRGRTLIEAGARNWMLFEDPDLENLRMHPRFSRWATATFGVLENEFAADQNAQMDKFVENLRHAEWYNQGLYGMEQRWSEWSRRWWIANYTYLSENLRLVTPTIQNRHSRARLRAVGEPGQEEIPRKLRANVVALTDLDTRVWRLLANYGRFAARLDMRLHATPAR